MRSLGIRWRAAAVLVGLLALAGAGGRAAPSVPSTDQAIAHALNRLTFGPRPGDAARVQAIGLAAWIDRQLHPARIDDAALGERLRQFETLTLDSTQIARDYFIPARQARRAGKQAATDTQGPAPQMTAEARRGRLPLRELGEAKVLRAVYSERQLEEVLVDFWFNHFNVFAGKGRTGVYVTEYEREAIRPHVLGKFRTLLEATAKSPAMLFYLDNWMSADPASAAKAPAKPGRPRGLNENYARELMELHTLGVDGGYTQQDVVEVARAFTGWTIGADGSPRRNGRGKNALAEAGFRFAPRLHDAGEKHVLGHTIRAGGGIDDGEQVLDILARHPSTARHIATELARRFVSDTPPPALVDRAAQRFRDTNGDLGEVVRTIVTSPEFFAPGAQLAKVKTPLEFVASALRASGADVTSAAATLRTLQQLGMMPYMCQPPTGYDDTADAWLSSGALVTRMNFATQLASGRVPGIRVPDAPPDLGARLGAPEFQKR